MLDEGISNARISYNQGLTLNRLAESAKKTSASVTLAGSSIGAVQLQSSISGSSNRTSSFTTSKGSSFIDGSAARKLNPASSPKSDKKREYKRSLYTTVQGSKKRGPMQSTVLSPALMSAAKLLGAVVIFVAIMSFIRVGLSSATVTAGIQSQSLSNKIETELINKNELEVADSALANSSRIRTEAGNYSLVTPSAIEQINLAPDVLSADSNGNVSLVDSLNRLANTVK